MDQIQYNIGREREQTKWRYTLSLAIFYLFIMKICYYILDPKIDIQFDEGPFRRQVEQDVESVIDVFCSINAAAGKPRFRIGYESSGYTKHEIIDEETDTDFRKHHYRGQHRALMRIPASGVITCTVTDDLDEYFAERTITVQGRHKPQGAIISGDELFSWLKL